MFLISLSIHMTSIFVLCLVHVLHKKDTLTEVSAPGFTWGRFF
jgi:hypothetical protein